MSAPRVFKRRTEETTMEEFAASDTSTKTEGAKEGDDNEEILLVKSDITSPGGVMKPVAAETKKRSAGRFSKSNAFKKPKRTVGPEAAIESSQTVSSSVENESSSHFSTLEPPLPVVAKVTKARKPIKAVSDQQAGHVARMSLSAPVALQDETDTEHYDNDAAQDNAPPEPTKAPKTRYRFHKTQATSSSTLADSVHITRAATRNSIKNTPSIAIPEKRISVTHGRGVGRLKKTPSKSDSSTPQFTEEEYTVEKIIDFRIDPVTKEQMYMIKWKGYSAKDNTWEPKKNLGKCTSMIKYFHNSQKEKGKK